MRVSVVIPTWNEAAWLPRLLKALDQLHGVDEVIVADNKSSDGTEEVALRNSARLVSGGRPGVARNKGAAIAKGDVLVFIDADTVISQDVINLVRSHLADPRFVAVHFRSCPITGNKFRRLCYSVMDTYFRLLSFAGLAFGVGSFIAVKNSAFKRVGGFNEGVKAAEDLDLLRRLSRDGKIKYETSVPVYVSSRRFDVEIVLIYVMKCLLWAFLRLAGTDRSLVSYSWTAYPHFLAERESNILEANLISARRNP